MMTAENTILAYAMYRAGMERRDIAAKLHTSPDNVRQIGIDPVPEVFMPLGWTSRTVDQYVLDSLLPSRENRE